MRTIIDFPGQIDTSIILCTHVFYTYILNRSSQNVNCELNSTTCCEVHRRNVSAADTLCWPIQLTFFLSPFFPLLPSSIGSEKSQMLHSFTAFLADRRDHVTHFWPMRYYQWRLSKNFFFRKKKKRDCQNKSIFFSSAMNLRQWRSYCNHKASCIRMKPVCKTREDT